MNRIDEFDISYLYEIFSELDEIGYLEVSDDFCQSVLSDPVISSVLPSVVLDCSSFFELPAGFEEYLRIQPEPPVNNTVVFMKRK